MKKLIIYMPKLSVGGMEKALINLLNFSSITKKYEVELFLGYLVQKEYLNMIPQNVRVYLCCKGNWNIFGKLITYFKMMLKNVKVVLKIDKYDVAISYAYQHPILAKLARNSSRNNIIFIHGNLIRAFKNQSKRFRKIKFYKFAKVICVSNESRQIYNKLFPDFKGKVITINNFIDGSVIEKQSLKKITFNYNKPVFVTVGRCVEKAKKFSRIIKSSVKLKKEGYKFSVLIIGDGEDFSFYENMITESKVSDVVHLLGKKINPYPYIKNSSALILSSAYEGYGIVIDEARILNVPVISTDVADAKEIMNEGYGILCDNSDDGVYNGMKQFLDEGYVVANKFDYNKFNDEMNTKLESFIKE